MHKSHRISYSLVLHYHHYYDVFLLTQVLVVNLRPEVKIVHSFSLPGQPDCLPLVSWRFAGIKVPGQASVMDPVLAVARQSTVHFFQVCSTYADPFISSMCHINQC